MEVLEPVLYNTGKEALDNNCTFVNTDHPMVSSSSLVQIQLCGAQSDTAEPEVQVTDIQWQSIPEEIGFKPKVVDTLASINNNAHPVDKMFNFSWSTEEEQSTTWSQQLSTEKDFECNTEFPGSDCALKITHDHMGSTSTTSMVLSLKKSLQVTMAPRKTTIANLVLLASEITEVPFVATVKFVGSNKASSEYKVEGVWKGSLYKLSSSVINVYETELGIM